MDLLDGMRAFLATADSGSFTAAADRLGISNRLTSKYVAELEERLGVRLLQRTTRRVGVTPAGEELRARLPHLIDEFDSLLADVSETRRGFSGTVRVSAPVTFGEIYVQDILRRFAQPHPDLVIDLRLDDAHVDLAADGIDLAFRIGQPTALALKARRLASMEAVLVASPGYLERHPGPDRPEDLADHACIIDTNRRAAAKWTLVSARDRASVSVRGRYFVNSAPVARDLAIAGQGIAFCPSFVLREALAKRSLVRVLPGHGGEPLPLNAVYLEGRALPQKVRALIDFARQEMARAGPL